MNVSVAKEEWKHDSKIQWGSKLTKINVGLWLLFIIFYILIIKVEQTRNLIKCFNHFKMEFGQRLVGISYQMVSKFIEPNKRWDATKL